MSHNRNILLKVCIFTMVFVCHGWVFDAIADDPNTLYVDPAVTYTDNNDVTTADVNVSQKIICPVNKYLSRCGDYYIGFNWLKGLKSDPKHNNYYYETYSEEPEEIKKPWPIDTMFKQMQKFFHGDTQPASYNSGESLEFKWNRDVVLGNLCNPFNKTLFCEPCPDGGKTPGASKVTVNPNDRTIVPETWQVYTFADCYLTALEDTTGTYSYYKNHSEQKCYFTSDDADALNKYGGNEIEDYVPNTSTTVTPTIIHFDAQTITVY